MQEEASQKCGGDKEHKDSDFSKRLTIPQHPDKKSRTSLVSQKSSEH